MTHSIKLVFGDTASSKHLDGATDDEVREWGSIEEFTFATEEELGAFLLGVEAAEGWLGYCEYDPDNLRVEEEDA